VIYTILKGAIKKVEVYVIEKTIKDFRLRKNISQEKPSENREGVKERYAEAMNLTMKGISECIKFGRLPIFLHLLFNEGYILLSMKQHIRNVFSMLDELSKHSEVVCLCRIFRTFSGRYAGSRS